MIKFKLFWLDSLLHICGILLYLKSRIWILSLFLLQSDSFKEGMTFPHKKIAENMSITFRNLF